MFSATFVLTILPVLIIGASIILVASDATFAPRELPTFLASTADFALIQGTRTTKELIAKSANMYFLLKWGNWFVAKIMQVIYNGPSLSDMGGTDMLIKSVKNSKCFMLYLLYLM